jgi:proteasome assembly chaperone (PAC2) family protein
MYSEEPFEPQIIEQKFKDLSEFKTLKNPICIMGVPDLTTLGKDCTEFLIEELKAEKVMVYLYSDFAPIGLVTHQEEGIALTKVKFYVAQLPDKRGDFIIITGNGSPKSPIGINFLSDRIAEFVSSFEPKLFISIAPIPVSNPTQNPRVYLAHTSETLLPLFDIENKKCRNENLRLETLDKGIVLGLNGTTVGFAKSLYNINGAILLSETFNSTNTDLIAVKAILSILNYVFELKLPFNSIPQEIKRESLVNSTNSLSRAEILKNIRKRLQT